MAAAGKPGLPPDAPTPGSSAVGSTGLKFS